MGTGGLTYTHLCIGGWSRCTSKSGPPHLKVKGLEDDHEEPMQPGV